MASATDGASVREWVKAVLAEQSTTSDPMVSRQTIVMLAPGGGHDRSAVRYALADLAADDEVIEWCGRYAPTDEDSLRAVIEQEAESSISRKSLVGKANRLLYRKRDRSGGSNDA